MSSDLRDHETELEVVDAVYTNYADMAKSQGGEKSESKDESLITCAHKGCGIQFGKELYRGGEATEHIEYHRAYDAILDTRLFCMKSGENNAQQRTTSLVQRVSCEGALPYARSLSIAAVYGGVCATSAYVGMVTATSNEGTWVFLERRIHTLHKLLGSLRINAISSPSPRRIQGLAVEVYTERVLCRPYHG